MASAEHEPIMGVWGQSPQRGPGAEPLVRGAKPPKAESILVIGCPTEPANLAPLVKFSKYSCNVHLIPNTVFVSTFPEISGGGVQTPKTPSSYGLGLLPVSLLGEQRHDGCEQYA